MPDKNIDLYLDVKEHLRKGYGPYPVREATWTWKGEAPLKFLGEYVLFDEHPTKGIILHCYTIPDERNGTSSEFWTQYLYTYKYDQSTRTLEFQGNKQGRDYTVSIIFQ